VKVFQLSVPFGPCDDDWPSNEDLADWFFPQAADSDAFLFKLEFFILVRPILLCDGTDT
jgi:hypothetical protein